LPGDRSTIGARAIRRTGSKRAAPDAEKFLTQDILYVSEIRFIVDDQPTTATKLNKDLGLQVYPQGSSFWWATGDERGLLLCIPRRKWGTPPGKVKTFEVLPPSRRSAASRARRTRFRTTPRKLRSNNSGIALAQLHS